MLGVFLLYLAIGIAVVAICMENAPLYKDGKFVYKEWFTIFGIKIKISPIILEQCLMLILIN